ncbi:MAG TPA: GvpL/GvpF family gas vesicle protein [Gemmatimonadaceae bacterium]|nr:GvpL/GvpF family gas vesicle protein [Gemmatimonadaceae bacterium]
MATPGTGFGAVVAGARGTSLRLIGIVHEANVGDAVRIVGHGASGISFRDVAAVVRPSSTRPETQSDEALSAHHAMVVALSRACSTIPAPPLTTFRSPAAALQWLELHAVALADGLAYVDGRAGARVTAERDLTNVTSDPSVLTPSAAAIESFRALRRYADATVPVSSETVGDGTTIATEAFLVDRASWARFAAEVAAEDERSPGLILRLTGPWPVYDFVRLQF